MNEAGRIAGTSLLVDSLETLGLRTVFGLPGSQNLPVFEAFRKSRLRVVPAFSEMSAGFMACGYYRASGEIPVLCTIGGPGMTCAFNALVEARHDSVPLIYLLSSNGGPTKHRFAFQHVDAVDIARHFAKDFLTVREVGMLPGQLRQAFQTAVGAEPGPVVVSFKPEILEQSAVPDGIGDVTGPQGALPDRGAVLQAADLISASSRPLLFVGQGAVGAFRQVRQLVGLLQCPVLPTPSGRGIVPDDDPAVVGYDFGGPETERLVDQADLILVLGCKFTGYSSGGARLRLPTEKLVRVDSCAAVLGANYPARLPIRADARAFLEQLLEEIGKSPLAKTSGSLWGRTQGPDPTVSARQTARIPDVRPHDFPAFFSTLNQLLPSEACVVTDSGQHEILVQRHLRVREPRSLIIPSDFQSMGFGLPAAIGAAVSSPQRRVVLLTGDGGLMMSLAELATAARHKLNLLILLLNDHAYGILRRQQLGRYGKAFCTELPAVDFESLARGLQISYWRGSGRLAGLLEKGLSVSGPALVEFEVSDSLPYRFALAKGRLASAARRFLKQEEPRDPP